MPYGTTEQVPLEVCLEVRNNGSQLDLEEWKSVIIFRNKRTLEWRTKVRKKMLTNEIQYMVGQ